MKVYILIALCCGIFWNDLKTFFYTGLKFCPLEINKIA